MGRKKTNQNVLVNDLQIDENLLTDDENVPVVKQSSNLRSRQSKKKQSKKQQASTVTRADNQNKVMKDANLINISDFESPISSEMSDNQMEPNDDLVKAADATNENEFNFLGDFLSTNRQNEDDSETDEFKRNLDLNLKKKKRIFLSSDRTDFLNFILSEQHKLDQPKSATNLIQTNQSSKYNTRNSFKLTTFNKHRPHDYSDEDDEDVNSEFNLLLNHTEHSSDTDQFAGYEDDALDYYLVHKSTRRRFRRLFNYFTSLFKFRLHAKTNNLNSYLLNRIDQRPLTSNHLNHQSQNSLPDRSDSEDDLKDLNLDISQFSSLNSETSFIRRLKESFLHLTNYLNSNKPKRQSNKNYNYLINKHSTAEHVDLLNEQDGLDQDGWYDGGHQINVRLVKSQPHIQPESMLFIMVQVFIPFLIAGFGTVGAGLVLDTVQHWTVFQNISEVFILVPALLGLKGNLEMTLASRLSTQANIGNLNTFKSQIYMSTGNLALIQCQATVVGFLAALFAIAVNWLPNAEFNLRHALLLCASSLLTASLASFILGIVMIVVVILSHKCSINPDNVATPIAASLGDLTTLALLAQISSFLYTSIDESTWICVLCIVIMVALVPLWVVIADRNNFTRQVLYTGWTPVVSAMAISSIGGCILDFAVSRFKGIAVFQPVINGVGGNLVAVQASRISTFLHQRHRLGELDKKEKDLCISPFKTFFADNVHAKTAKVLILLVVPGHLIFIQGIKWLQAGHTSITTIFLQFYLLAALIQVFILLYIAQIIIFWMWKKKIDPDNSAIPYLTAIGDFLGTGLLSVAFYVLFKLSDADEDVGE